MRLGRGLVVLAVLGPRGRAGAQLTDQPQIIAEFNDWAGLLHALRTAREKRNISMAMLDELGGMPERLSSKVLGPTPQRRLDVLSLHKFMFGLGIKCLVVDDPETLPMVQECLQTRNICWVRADGLHILLSRKKLAALAKSGGKARWAGVLPSERRRHAQRAAHARWAAVRAARRAARLHAEAQAARPRSAARAAPSRQGLPPSASTLG